MTLYDLLEISSDASPKEIKYAYKKLAKKYHPDINKNGQDMFVRINNAYSILSDPIQKVKYDMMVNISNSRTFEIFSNSGPQADYMSQSDLWHQSFMQNNTPTRQWNFDYSSAYEPTRNVQTNNYQNLTVDGLGAFLDKDISLAFYEIYKDFKISPILQQRLLVKPEMKINRVNQSNLIEFLKLKYDYSAWIETKRFFDIEAILELTPEEIRQSSNIKMPLKIKVINDDRRYEIWHEELRNYAFNIPTNTQNGEISEFFNKGNKALGWQGDLVITMKVVPQVIRRLKIYSNMLNTDRTHLWFFIPNNKVENPNNRIFDYKTYEYKD
ncbi:DnaJ domain-containing protein [[Mycoplasma] testudinis]|uniref:DnaJ domain-containing protein n=1 Tax=[Mycoplasma] testudinis TaxID=33924 RepID=UPI0004830699|nr:DnaJ domain-containing protein [[Mycoplasma] testudinis]